MDPVSPQYISMSSLLKQAIANKNIYFTAKAQERFRDNLNI